MALVRWNPARELLDVDREFKRMFNNFENRFGFRKEDDNAEYESAVWAPLTDIAENNDSYSLKLDLPGVDKKDVKISYSNGELQISGERKEEKEEKDSKYHRVERSFGKYFRSFRLPEKIKDDQIKAEFKNGSLNILIPKADEVKPKEIDIKVN
ncbi:MAG: Hsp20/alpha crystallin family protein [Ignavibacteriae bacterium]|nr:Hsp20/alpha crystallin family protein [Ignavibacteriota bacterium]